MFSDSECERLLLVDASNALNNLNCQLALISISQLCPALSQILINSYRSDTELFLDDETVCPLKVLLRGILRQWL